MIKGDTAMKSSDLHIPRWVAIAAVGVALVGGGVLEIGLKNWTGHDAVFGAGNPLGVSVARDSAPVPLGNFANGFASVLKPVLPAVVNIHTSKTVKTEDRQGPQGMFNDPFFQQFFGNQGQGGEGGNGQNP